MKDINSSKMVGEYLGGHKFITWYKHNLPNKCKMGMWVMHGDYKLDKFIFHPEENHMIGILN